MPFIHYLKHYRFAFKLALAVIIAFITSTALELPSTRWAIMTAALVVATPAFITGSASTSQIRHRGLLRVLGTLVGGLFTLVLVTLVKDINVMWLLTFLWMGFCAWQLTLINADHSYLWGLSGYTVLIIFFSSHSPDMVSRQIIFDRCFEISIGVFSALLSDVTMFPHSVKKNINKTLTTLLIKQYAFFQGGLNLQRREYIELNWCELVKNINQLTSLQMDLILESPGQFNNIQRIKALELLSYRILTYANESEFIVDFNSKNFRPSLFVMLKDNSKLSAAELYQYVKLRKNKLVNSNEIIPPAIHSWFNAMEDSFYLMSRIKSNLPLDTYEKNIIQKLGKREKSKPLNYHNALLNSLRAIFVTGGGYLLWQYSGINMAGGAMITLAIVTMLSARAENPTTVAMDFIISTLLAIPLSFLIYFGIFPYIQYNFILICLALTIFILPFGIIIPTQLIASLGTLLSTLNLLAISYPLVLKYDQFWGNALGQFLGCVLAWAVLKISRVNVYKLISKRLMRKLAMPTLQMFYNEAKLDSRDILPNIYEELRHLILCNPGEVKRHRMLLSLIVVYHRLNEERWLQTSFSTNELRAFKSTLNKLLLVQETTNTAEIDHIVILLELTKEKLFRLNAPYTIIGPIGHLIKVTKEFRYTLR